MGTSRNELLEQIRILLAHGFKLTCVKAGEKIPAFAGWTEGESEAIVLSHLEEGGNLGMVTNGELSGAGIVAVDIDNPELLPFAWHFLPPTKAIEGRPGHPDSHWFYKLAASSELANERLLGWDRTKLVDIFGINHLVVIPPSRHPSGEVRSWREPPSLDPDWIGTVSFEVLRRSVHLMVLVWGLVRLWREGSRHDLALWLSGSAFRMGIPAEEVEQLVEAVCRFAGDPELSNRLACVRDTYERGRRGIWIKGLEHSGLPREVVGWLLKELGTVFRRASRPMELLPDRILHYEAYQRLAQIFRERGDVFFSRKMLLFWDRESRRIETIPYTHAGVWTIILGKLGIGFVNQRGEMVNPPSALRTILAAGEWEQDFPDLELKGILRVPSVFQFVKGLRDGWLLLDETTPRPEDAPRHIQRILSGFPFASEEDRTAAAVLVITAVLFSVMKAPAFIITAHGPGSGKTELCRRIKLLVDGTESVIGAETNDDDEFRKILLGVANAGEDNVLVFDNLVETPDLPSLKSAMTSDSLTIRILGTNKLARFHTYRIWMFNGNNLRVSDEMARRSVFIMLRHAGRQEAHCAAEPAPVVDQWIFHNRVQICADLAAWLRGLIDQSAELAYDPNWGTTYGDWFAAVRAGLQELARLGILSKTVLRPASIRLMDREAGEEALFDPVIGDLGINLEDLETFFHAWFRAQSEQALRNAAFRGFRVSDLLDLAFGPDGSGPLSGYVRFQDRRSLYWLRDILRKLNGREIGDWLIRRKRLSGHFRSYFYVLERKGSLFDPSLLPPDEGGAGVLIDLTRAE